MNTESIGRSMGKVINELQKPDEMPATNSTFAIGGAYYSANNFVFNESLVLRINICAKSALLKNLQTFMPLV